MKILKRLDLFEPGNRVLWAVMIIAMVALLTVELTPIVEWIMSL